ncbi:chemotaxis protein CheW [Helicobacter muridarum]|uniref:Chemotaxis protein CheW n=1 Tax=Helicobacter muridarum TaxID=216 RepID=A0A099U0G8_9HELI|nr:chemotaxis protein CheW [Helicobacter muridarum]TLE00638.1 chemotaxis protein CheW [Helicobacter muridarum]STQ85656.1 chemotaxis signal transduction response regulator [Helicobacter muridarum]
MDNKQIKDVFAKQQKQLDGSELHGDSENIVQLIGFVVGTEEFAVPILNVKEIIKPIDFTRVPGTPDYVMGVFNLRGNVYPLINLRMKFGIPPNKQDGDTRYLVVNHNDEIAGFVIDKLTEAIRIDESLIDPIPDTFDEKENLMYGIAKQGDRLTTILRVDSLLKRTF